MQNTDKFALYAGHNYYALGGFDDFEGMFADQESAAKYLNKNTEIDVSGSWAHLVDLANHKIICRWVHKGEKLDSKTHNYVRDGDWKISLEDD